MSLTSFRETIAATLSNGLGIPFVPGKLEGPQKHDIGCTFPDRKGEFPENVDLEQLQIFVRVYKKFERSRNQERPRDPAELEAIAEQIQTLLYPQQTSAGPWFFRVTEIEFDMDDNGLQALIVSWESNLFKQV